MEWEAALRKIKTPYCVLDLILKVYVGRDLQNNFFGLLPHQNVD